MTDYEYHMVYTYTGVNFLLMFLPLEKSFSIDNIREIINNTNKKIRYKETKVFKISYYLPVFLGIGLVYFDSAAMYKINSPMWLGGLGLWLPSSVPVSTITDNQWFLNQEFVVKFLSYLTMIFEFMFIFLFWNKRFRFVLFILGVLLHLGILIEFPIPYFATGYISIYVLMVPVCFWEKLIYKVRSKRTVFTLSLIHI